MENENFEYIKSEIADIKKITFDSLMPLREKNRKEKETTEFGHYIALINVKETKKVHQGVLIWVPIGLTPHDEIRTREDIAKAFPEYKKFKWLAACANGTYKLDVINEAGSFIPKSEERINKNDIRELAENLYAEFGHGIDWWNIGGAL